MTKTRLIPLITIATIAASASLIGEPALADDGGIYIGANFGRTLSTFSRADLDSSLTADFERTSLGFSLESSSVRKSESVWSVDIGYMTSPYLGFEASYLNLGTLKYRASATQSQSAGTSAVAVDLNIKSKGPSLALVGVLPLSNAWEVDGRVGAYRGKTSTHFTSVIDTSTNSGSDSTSATSLLLGVGGSFAIAGHWMLRLDFLRLNNLSEKVFERSFNVNLVTGGLTYAF